MPKILVVFYSYEGSTRRVAKLISRYLKADMLEIKPKVEMTAKGFSKFIWGGSQVVMGIKPDLLPLDKNLDDYDLIFLGSPIWAGTFAPPIRTILEKNYMEDKKIAYFYCHDGGERLAISRGKVAIEKNNIFVGAKAFMEPKKDIDVEQKVHAWVDEILNKEKN